MNKFIFAVYLLMAIYSMSTEVSGMEKDCRSIVSDLNKREILGISTCTKEMRSQFKNVRDKIAKSTCIMKCVLRKENILTEAGEFKQDNIDAFIAREFPERLHEKIRGIISPCVEQYGGSLDNEEEFCKSYDPVIKCFSSKLPTFCKN